ncbi:MAG: M3 family oligoendopeptidase [Hymenobacteraceae bacterium]|nr:M3 family oligoendopeptidase [Hymenobacteraceae bacterium]
MLTSPIHPSRHFLPAAFTVTSWATVQPFYDDLRDRPIASKVDLETWLADRSELESVLSEDLAWRYIRMTCDTKDEARTAAYQFFVTEIEPPTAPYENALNEKLVASPYTAELDEARYAVLLRGVRQALALFREANIPLKTKISTRQQEYAALSGAMTVPGADGKPITLQRAALKLKETDRAAREAAWRQIQVRRLEDKEKLDGLFSDLLALRHQVALNAGYANFRDYSFAALGRFDYGVQDTLNFHESIREHVVPLITALDRERQHQLGVEELRPWDLDVDPTGLSPLKPFSTGEELLEKSIRVFTALDPYLGGCLSQMRDLGRLDLESRIGKAPGGYNYPLDETGVPFIFMNATASLRDVVTMVHEGGHAVHAFLSHPLAYNFDKHPPSEVAELASMAMELLTMDYWHEFFPDPADLRRAKRQHLEGVLETFPWVATIDKFQHWLYENPEHPLSARHQRWADIFDEFNQRGVSWRGLETVKPYLWQKQLHLYEVPFYYIEYALAQLGAIAVWKNYRQNPTEALAAYQRALALGYTAPIGQIYEAAGIRFDFSPAYIRELAEFVQAELAAL